MENVDHGNRLCQVYVGVQLLQGPEIERDGDCIVTACLSQVLSDIWSLSVIINNDIVFIIITTSGSEND